MAFTQPVIGHGARRGAAEFTSTFAINEAVLVHPRGMVAAHAHTSKSSVYADVQGT